MKVVVFGASGKVGRQVVAEALSDGHDVVAFIHSHHDLPDNPKLTVITGDIHNNDDVDTAVKGTDAVISALGSWGTPSKDILSSAMGHIIPAMKKYGVSRIISLTGSEARAVGDDLSVIHRMAHAGASIAANKILYDGEKHIQLLEKSGLNWTVLRSPVMMSRPSGVFSVSAKRPLPWSTVSRQAVAKALVRELSDTHSQQALFIS